MKKVIKLLFPKTYQAIINEGYNQAYSEYHGYDQDYDDYDDYNYNDYDDPDPDYNEYHQNKLDEEYYAECVEEYENERRKAEKLLAETHNHQPPLLDVGDKIHLHSKLGMYTVAEVYNDSFAYCTKYSELSYADYSDYKCHAGGRWNKRGE